MYEIHCSLKSIYGRDAYYPACPLSRAICDAAGTKTLSDAMRATLVRSHGWAIIIDEVRQ